MVTLVVILSVAVALLGVLVAGLLRSHAEILRALHDLGVNLEDGEATSPGGARVFDVREPPRAAAGMPQPTNTALTVAYDLRGQTPSGDAAQVGVTASGTLTLLAFLSSGCGTCSGFWDALRSGETLPGSMNPRVVAVTRGPEAESPAEVARLDGPDGITLMSTEAYEDYRVPMAPYFVLVDGGGLVLGEGAASSWDQLGGLLERAVSDGVVGSADEPSRRDVLSGKSRRRRVEDDLSAAGIGPGHPSLYDDPTEPPT